MNINRELLQRKITARNSVNAKVNELRPVLTKLLTPYVGKKVVKGVPSGWVAKIANQINSELRLELTGFRLFFRFYINYSINGIGSVTAEVDTTYKVADMACGYVEQAFTVCDLDRDKLRGFINWEPYRTDYTLEEVLEGFAELERLETEACAIKSQLREFIK